MDFPRTEKDFQPLTGCRRFAQMMAAAAPFTDYEQALTVARDIWFNKVDVNGWLEAFAVHPEIGTTKQISQRCKDEQGTALATATNSTTQEVHIWNSRYKEKFGFVFLISASGKSMSEILDEMKNRYANRPIVELENASTEEMKIIELRLAKLFESDAEKSSLMATETSAVKPRDRVGILGAHFTAVPKASGHQIFNATGDIERIRPPITTHILDVSRGSPASGVEVHLEAWRGSRQRPSFNDTNFGEWVLQGSSVTDKDGRSGPLMSMVDHINPGFYRISFDTGNYVPSGFFPYVSIVFEVKETQKSEHFHVPLLLSPFSFTTYRGS